MIERSGAGGKRLVVLSGRIMTPPFSASARREAGTLIRALQEGRMLGMPRSRPMPGIGARCHELRIVDEDKSWRIVYRIDPDAVVVVDIFQKATQQTPVLVLEVCRKRLRRYDASQEEN
jgi:phage-related protein